MKKLLFILFAALSAATSQAQPYTVSGTVKDSCGQAIANASIREIDHNKRVINHTQSDENGIFTFKVRNGRHALQVMAPGYRKITHKLLNYKRVNITLEKRRTSPLAGNEKIVLRSDQLFCGRYMNENVKQWAWIEQLNDTTFCLVLPISTKTEIDEYPQGRTLTILSATGQHLMQWNNVADVYPIIGSPGEQSSTVLAQSYTNDDYVPGAIADDKESYVYPHFQFSLSQLKSLAEHPEDLQRMVVDTYKADNYWNFYPTNDTDRLLKELLQKVTGK